MSIVGKFFFHSTEEHSSSGEILEEVCSGIFLVLYDKCGCANVPGQPKQLLSAEAMTTDPDAEDLCFWEFWDTREELEAYKAWLFAPSEEKTEGNVVTMPKPH